MTFVLKGVSGDELVVVGLKIDKTDRDAEYFTEYLSFSGPDGSLYREAVISNTTFPPLWRFICIAVETKVLTFIITVDNNVLMNFTEPALKLFSREFPDKVSSLLGGPTRGFTGKITQINIHHQTQSPQDITCGRQGDIYRWRINANQDWDIGQLFLTPPKLQYGTSPTHLTPIFSICFQIFINRGNVIEFNIHGYNSSGTIGYHCKHSEYTFWEEYMFFSEQEKMVSRVLISFFPQWRNVCIGVDTGRGEVNVTFEGKVVLEKYVVKALVNTMDKVPESQYTLLNTIRWKYPSIINNISIFDEKIPFKNVSYLKDGNIYKWNKYDWEKDSILNEIVRFRTVKKDEICNGTSYLINTQNLDYETAFKTCKLIGDMASSVSDLSRTLGSTIL